MLVVQRSGCAVIFDASLTVRRPWPLWLPARCVAQLEWSRDAEAALMLTGDREAGLVWPWEVPGDASYWKCADDATCIAVERGGAAALVGRDDGTWQILDLERREAIHTGGTRPSPITAAVLVLSKNLAVVGYADGAVEAIHPRDAQPVFATFDAGTTPIMDVAVGLRSDVVYLTAADGTVSAWELAPVRRRWVRTGGTGQGFVCVLPWFRDRREVVYAAGADGVWVLDAQTGRVYDRFETYSGGVVMCMLMLREGNRSILVGGTMLGDVVAWSTNDGMIRRQASLRSEDPTSQVRHASWLTPGATH